MSYYIGTSCSPNRIIKFKTAARGTDRQTDRQAQNTHFIKLTIPKSHGPRTPGWMDGWMNGWGNPPRLFSAMQSAYPLLNDSKARKKSGGNIFFVSGTGDNGSSVLFFWRLELLCAFWLNLHFTKQAPYRYVHTYKCFQHCIYSYLL